jgi:CRP-like cAMP-binding protein
MVLPLLESTPEALVERAKQSFGIETSSREEALETLRSSPDAWLRRCATYETGERSESMNTIERVILLQGVELFAGATTEQLSFIAAISRETRATTGTILYRQGDEPNGLYVVISGRVAVTRGADVIETIGPNGSFGVWALFDDQPRLTDAAAVEDSNVLFVPREDFYDVLSDHVEITQSVFKHLVQRVRRLASVGERDGA